MINLLFELCIEDLPTSKVEIFLKIFVSSFYKNIITYNIHILKSRIFFSNSRISLVGFGISLNPKNRVTLPLNIRKNNYSIFINDLLKFKKFYIRNIKVLIYFNGLIFISNTKAVRSKILINLFAKSIENALIDITQDNKMFWLTTIKNFIRPVHYFNFVCNTFCVNYKFFGIKGNLNTVGNKFKNIKKFFLNPTNYEKKLEFFCFVIPCLYKRIELLRRKLNFLLRNNCIKTGYDVNLLVESASFFEYPISFLGNFCAATDCISNFIFLYSVQKKIKSFVFFFTKNHYYFIHTVNVVKNISRKVYNENRAVLLEHMDEIVRLTTTDREVFFYYKIINLKSIIFLDSLGTFFDKIKRIYFLSLMFVVKNDVDLVSVLKGSLLCKLDICSCLVSEYPELKGIAGKFYALYNNVSVDVALSLEEHYLPKKNFFNNILMPRTNLGIKLAVSDRIDNVVNLFSVRRNNITNDLFGLRRQILSVIKIVNENSIDIDIFMYISYAISMCLKNTITFLFDIFIFINERIFFMYKKLGFIQDLSCFFSLGYPIRYPYDFHKKLTDRVFYLNIYNNCKINFIERRLSNILVLNKYKNDVLDMLLYQSFYDIKLYLFITNVTLNLKYLLQKKLYFCIYELINVLWFVLDDFFKYNYLNVKNKKLKTSRIHLLVNIYNILNSCFKFTFL